MSGERATASDDSVTLDQIKEGYKEVQDAICAFLEEVSDQEYSQDLWDYDKGTGGGRTRVWEGNYDDGAIIEKGGVNFSAIHGPKLPSAAATAYKLGPETPFAATGVSLVIHPSSPHIPTIHMNIRYFVAGDLWWFGGGIDLTPYYPQESHVIEFHSALKSVCDQFGQNYRDYKIACDDYFFLKHRNERRGVGGLFYDHVDAKSGQSKLDIFKFSKALGMKFIDLYRPFFSRGLPKEILPRHREYQLLRRSRYVEFNLLFDRGTKFGIQSHGRTESILMSMPSIAKWKYDWKPEPGSEEEQVMRYYLQPHDWLGMEKNQ